MDYGEIVVKESPGLCRCCLSEGCYKDLATEYPWMDDTEVYADMLFECFDISISQHPTGPNGSKRLICEVCITRLRDACNFKKQVQDSERKFIDMLARGDFENKESMEYEEELPMKSEMIVEDEPIEAEYLEDMDDFDEDDLPLSAAKSQQPTTSKASDPEPAVRKRKRPAAKKPTGVKQEKKPKLAVKKAVAPKQAKGLTRPALTTLSSTKRNRLTKRNSTIVLENTTVTPFKWHRHNYLCFYCHEPFKDSQLLISHTKNKHTHSNIQAAVSYLRRDEKVKIDVTDAKCRICEENLENLDAILSHLKTEHNKDFAEDFELSLIPYSLNSDSYQCAICEAHFPYFVKLNQHMNDHYGTYLCPTCGRSFLSQARLVCHTLTHGSKFRCTLCDDIFDTLTQRNNHEAKVHQKNKMLKCVYCDMMFKNYDLRKKHYLDSHNVGIEQFRCEICSKTFHIKSKMTSHIQEVHVREKNYSCSLCDHKFFSKTHVKKHMIKHFGERIHHCNICKKSYARKQTLRDHMKTQCGDKKFVCYVCGQEFGQNNSFKLHMKMHSKSDVTE